MYTSQGRFWLTLICIGFICWPGCKQPPQQQSRPGHLPGPVANRGGVEPKVNATTYFAHGHLLERQGQFERAVVQYRKALGLQPEFLSARNRLGITLNKLGRNAEASEQFRQAIACQPELAHLHNNLGFSLYLEGLYAEAVAPLDQALALRPDFSRAHMNRALALAKLGRFDETFSELTLACDEADAYFNMGMLLSEAGRYADAAHYLENALTLSPKFDAARQQLREVSRLAAEFEAWQATQITAETPTESTEPEPEGLAQAEVAPQETVEEPAAEPLAEATSDDSTPPPDDETPPTEDYTDVVTTVPEQADTDDQLQQDSSSESVDDQTDVAMTAPEQTDAEEPFAQDPAAVPLEESTDDTNVAVAPESVAAMEADDAAELGAPQPGDSAVAEGTEVEETWPDSDELVTVDPEFMGWPDCVLLDPAALGNDVLLETDDSAGDFDAVEAWPERDPDEPVDVEVLFGLIDEAMWATDHDAGDADELWCRVNDYLFPDNTPHVPFSEQDSSGEEDIVREPGRQTPIGK